MRELFRRKAKKEMKGGWTAGEIQQVCMCLCMIRHLHLKFLTLQPEQVHIRAGSSAQGGVSVRLYQDQLLQINNSASSLSGNTLSETGR